MDPGISEEVIESQVLVLLTEMFPQHSRTMLISSIKHSSNRPHPLDEGILLQRCIDDLLDLRTFKENTIEVDEPDVFEQQWASNTADTVIDLSESPPEKHNRPSLHTRKRTWSGRRRDGYLDYQSQVSTTEEEIPDLQYCGRGSIQHPESPTCHHDRLHPRAPKRKQKPSHEYGVEDSTSNSDTPSDLDHPRRKKRLPRKDLGIQDNFSEATLPPKEDSPVGKLVEETFSGDIPFWQPKVIPGTLKDKYSWSGVRNHKDHNANIQGVGTEILSIKTDSSTSTSGATSTPHVRGDRAVYRGHKRQDSFHPLTPVSSSTGHSSVSSDGNDYCTPPRAAAASKPANFTPGRKTGESSCNRKSPKLQKYSYKKDITTALGRSIVEAADSFRDKKAKDGSFRNLPAALGAPKPAMATISGPPFPAAQDDPHRNIPAAHGGASKPTTAAMGGPPNPIPTAPPRNIPAAVGLPRNTPADAAGGPSKNTLDAVAFSDVLCAAATAVAAAAMAIAPEAVAPAPVVPPAEEAPMAIAREPVAPAPVVPPAKVAPMVVAPEPVAPAPVVPPAQRAPMAVAPEPMAPVPVVPPVQGAPMVVAPEPVAPAPVVPPAKVAPMVVAREPVAPALVVPPVQGAPMAIAPEPVAPAPVVPPAQRAPMAVAPEPVAPAPVVPPAQVAPKVVAPEPVAPVPVIPPVQEAPMAIAPEPVAPAPVVPPAQGVPMAVATETVAPETVAPGAVAPTLDIPDIAEQQVPPAGQDDPQGQYLIDLDERLEDFLPPDILAEIRADPNFHQAIIEEENRNPRPSRLTAEEVYKEVCDLFPDVDHKFVIDMVATTTANNPTEVVCNYLLEHPKYPRKKTPDCKESQAVSPASSTRLYPSMSHTISKNYYEQYGGNLSHKHIEGTLNLLAEEFPRIAMKDLRVVIRYFKNHFAPSRKYIVEGLLAAGVVTAVTNSKSQTHTPLQNFAFRQKAEETVVFISCLIKEQSGKKTENSFKYKLRVLRCGRPQTGGGSLISSLDQELQNEIVFVRSMIEKETQANDHKMAVTINETEYKAEGQTIECVCCYCDFPFESMVQCYEGHLFCKDCLKGYAEEAIYGQAKSALPCMTDGCDARFPKSQLESLPPEVLAKFEEREQVESINMADLENLVRCPGCEFAALMDEGDKVFKCQNMSCLKETCRYCQLDWTEHFGIPCSELEKKDETKLRLQYEEKMTEAKIRTCHKCKARYTKLDGCNKITCNCGSTMCYICRKPGIHYDHFCNHPREPGRGCDKCTACSLWTNPDEDEKRAIREIKEEASKIRKEQGYEDEKQIGAPEEASKLTKKR